MSVSVEMRQTLRITGKAGLAFPLISGFAPVSARQLAMHGPRSATVAAGILTGPRRDCQECAELSCVEVERARAVTAVRLAAATAT